MGHEDTCHLCRERPLTREDIGTKYICGEGRSWELLDYDQWVYLYDVRGDDSIQVSYCMLEADFTKD